VKVEPNVIIERLCRNCL